MSISFNKALGMHEAAMKLRVERAGLLSNNLANADTPNFKARDINFHEALAARLNNNSAIGLKANRKGHLAGAEQGGSGATRFFRVPSQPSIDGNTVEENIEHAEFSQNSMEFQVAFTLLNSKFKGLRKAIKGE